MVNKELNETTGQITDITPERQHIRLTVRIKGVYQQNANLNASQVSCDILQTFHDEFTSCIIS